MAKNSFVLYYNYREKLEDLTSEQKGQLLEAIFDYEIDGIEPNFTGELKMAFKFIKVTLDEDKIKYEEKCAKNRQNIQSRWKDTTEYDRIETNTNATDNDNDNVNDNVNDNDILREKEKVEKVCAKKFIPPTLEEVREYAKSRNSKVNPDDFYNFFTADDDVDKHWIDSKGNKVKNWKQKFVTWESYEKERNKNNTAQKDKTELSMWDKLNKVFDDE